MSQGLGWVLGAALVAGGVAVAYWWPATPRPAEAKKGDSTLPELKDSLFNGQGKTDFATGGEQKDDAKPVKLDSERALKYLKQLCDIGPRISASEGMKKQQELIEKHFQDAVQLLEARLGAGAPRRYPELLRKVIEASLSGGLRAARMTELLDKYERPATHVYSDALRAEPKPLNGKTLTLEK